MQIWVCMDYRFADSLGIRDHQLIAMLVINNHAKPTEQMGCTRVTKGNCVSLGENAMTLNPLDTYQFV